jgi:hypothetical protein
MKAALEQAYAERAERQDGPLTDAQRKARQRARARGEHVPERKPGPVSREDRLRAAVIASQAEVTRLEERVRELEAALRQRRR